MSCGNRSDRRGTCSSNKPCSCVPRRGVHPRHDIIHLFGNVLSWLLLEDVCDAGIQAHKVVVGFKDVDGIERVHQVVDVVVPGPRLFQMVRNKVLRETYLSPLWASDLM